MKFWETIQFMFSKREVKAPEINVPMYGDYKKKCENLIEFTAQASLLMARYLNVERVSFELIVYSDMDSGMITVTVVSSRSSRVHSVIKRGWGIVDFTELIAEIDHLLKLD